MNLDILNNKAVKVGDFKISDSYKDVTINQKVISQYVYIYLSNQREGNAHTKDRSEVSGGGKKPWKQKGTGRARVGSSRSPIWTKGGITFGPRNTVNYKRKTTKSFRKSAFQNAMSYLIQSDKLKVLNISEIVESDKLTKSAIEFLNAINNPKKVTIVLDESNATIQKAFSNLLSVNVVSLNKINPYLMLNGGVVLFEEAALTKFESNWGLVNEVNAK